MIMETYMIFVKSKPFDLRTSRPSDYGTMFFNRKQAERNARELTRVFTQYEFEVREVRV
jgi:hypothetical protein